MEIFSPDVTCAMTYRRKHMNCVVIDDDVGLGDDPVHTTGHLHPLPLFVDLPRHVERFPSKSQVKTPVRVCLNSYLQLYKGDNTLVPLYLYAVI